MSARQNFRKFQTVTAPLTEGLSTPPIPLRGPALVEFKRSIPPALRLTASAPTPSGHSIRAKNVNVLSKLQAKLLLSSFENLSKSGPITGGKICPQTPTTNPAQENTTQQTSPITCPSDSVHSLRQAPSNQGRIPSPPLPQLLSPVHLPKTGQNFRNFSGQNFRNSQQQRGDP